jgi:hypothetical protein
MPESRLWWLSGLLGVSSPTGKLGLRFSNFLSGANPYKDIFTGKSFGVLFKLDIAVGWRNPALEF